MTQKDAIKFLNKASTAIDSIMTINTITIFGVPYSKDPFWQARGTLVGEKGEEFVVFAEMYNFKGHFALIKDNKIIAKTPWISYKDSEMESKFESWNDIVCPNPYEYYGV